MPKRYLTERAKKEDKLREYVGKQLGGMGLTKTEVAHKLGYKCVETLSSRLKHPSLFTVGEIQTLFKVLRFSEEQIREVLL